MIWRVGSGDDSLGKELERISHEEYSNCKSSAWADFDRDGWVNFVQQINKHFEEFPNEKRYGIVFGDNKK